MPVSGGAGIRIPGPGSRIARLQEPDRPVACERPGERTCGSRSCGREGCALLPGAHARAGPPWFEAGTGDPEAPRPAGPYPGARALLCGRADLSAQPGEPSPTHRSPATGAQPVAGRAWLLAPPLTPGVLRPAWRRGGRRIVLPRGSGGALRLGRRRLDGALGGPPCSRLPVREGLLISPATISSRFPAPRASRALGEGALPGGEGASRPPGVHVQGSRRPPCTGQPALQESSASFRPLCRCSAPQGAGATLPRAEAGATIGQGAGADGAAPRTGRHRRAGRRDAGAPGGPAQRGQGSGRPGTGHVAVTATPSSTCWAYAQRGEGPVRGV